MKQFHFSIIVLSFFLIVGNSAFAKTVISETELRDKITNNKIGTIYLDPVDKGIGGLEVNQYGLVSDDVIVKGNYNKIPDDILKLAKDHSVTIAKAEGYGSSDDVFSYLAMRALPRFLYIIILFGILVFFILINKKLAKIIKLLTKNS